MRRGERIARHYGPDQTGKVAAYLRLRQLRRGVAELMEEIPDLEAFWLHKKFLALRVHHSPIERDRLSMENVLGRLNHCPNPNAGLFQLSRVRAGKLPLEDFIKSIIDTRKGNRV